MKKILPGLLIGGISAAIIFLTQVVFPSNGEDSVWLVMGAYLLIFLALFAAGFWYKISGGKGGGIRVGAITGAILITIILTAYFLVDNLFLSTVSRQTEKIWGFQQSRYGSMRAYLNWGLLRGLLLGLPLFIFFGAVMGGMGGVSAAYFFRKRNRRLPFMFSFLGRFLPYAAFISAGAFLLLVTGAVRAGYQLFTGWIVALVTLLFILIITELLHRSEKRPK